jgi:peptidyl-prolyl cis-trans isomerase B (cyclophilin B)
VRSAILVLVVLALAAGCGGGDETTASDEGCESVERPDAREHGQIAPPRQRLDDTKTYLLSFETSCGTFVVKLDLKSAPNTASSLVTLAHDGYFDDTIFHRIVPGFVIQGGDPTQSGTGGPGYWMLDKPPKGTRYTKGTFAMAKTSEQPAGMSGSQFFVVTAGDAGLQPDYAVAGRVTGGLDVVERIGELGDAQEQPTQTVLVRHVTVSTRP